MYWKQKMLTDIVCCTGASSSTLKVCGLPSGLHYSQLESYLADLVVIHGARRIDIIQSGSNSDQINNTASTVLAIFDSESAAQKALASNAACGGKYQLEIFHGGDQQPYRS